MMCAAATEVSAEGVEIGASIKAKGDAIRDLKAGGCSKEDLKPHIEVSLPPAQSAGVQCAVWRGMAFALRRAARCQHVSKPEFVFGCVCMHAATDKLATM